MKKTPSRAFTLTEILVALTIVGFVMAGTMAFYISTLKSNYASEQQLIANGEIRNFTEQLLNDARDANTMVLFDSFSNTDAALGSGQSGDYIIFITFSDPFENYNAASETSLPSRQITRIVAYWTAQNRNIPGDKALYMFDTDDYKGTNVPWSKAITFPVDYSTTTPIATTVAALLPPGAQPTDAKFKIVLDSISGQFNGHGFRNSTPDKFDADGTGTNTTTSMSFQLVHGNNYESSTGTYNFTITPRG